jgi:hypothetical protein
MQMLWPYAFCLLCAPIYLMVSSRRAPMDTKLGVWRYSLTFCSEENLGFIHPVSSLNARNLT